MSKITSAMIMEALNGIKAKTDNATQKLDNIENTNDSMFIKKMEVKSKKLLECASIIEDLKTSLECLEIEYDNMEEGYFEYLAGNFESALLECTFSDEELKKIEKARKIVTLASSIETSIDSLNHSYMTLLEKEERLCEMMETRQIEFADFVVLGNVFKCNKNHNIEAIQAYVSIMTPSGIVDKILVSAGYCEQCRVYFILESDYNKAKSKGILLCRQITRNVYEKSGDEIFDANNLNAESLLHQIGYNVNSQDNLTSNQRQKLLKLAIDNNLYSISGLLSFLDWLISRNKRVTNRNMTYALSKWSEDRDFVANYQLDLQRKIGVSSLTLKRDDSGLRN